MEYSRGTHVERVAGVWGHYGGEGIIAAIIGSVIVGLYPQPGFVGMAVALLIVGTVVASFMLMRRHDRRLCEACMAHMPLNPEAEVERKKARFWVAHTGSEARFFGPYLAVVFGSSFAYQYVGRPVWALIQLSLAYVVLSQTTHRRLQPWCPWCRSGGDAVSDLPEGLPSDDRMLI